MSSAAQLTANRANAHLSTGPKTPEGKHAIAGNALKHGLYSKSPIIPGESIDDYNALRDELLAEYQPQVTEDTLLCEQLIDSIWRSRRIERLETAWFTKNPDPDFSDPKVFRVWAEFGRQHARYQRIIQTCLRRLTPALGHTSAGGEIELALNLEIARLKAQTHSSAPLRQAQTYPTANIARNTSASTVPNSPSAL